MRLNETKAVALAVPTVIDNDVLITRCFHAVAHHGVGGFADELFIDITREFILIVSPKSDISFRIQHHHRLRRHLNFEHVVLQRGVFEIHDLHITRLVKSVM